MDRSIVKIWNDGKFLGVGLLVSSEYVLTCYHVVSYGTSKDFDIYFPLIGEPDNEFKFNAEIFKVDERPKIDSAILKLKKCAHNLDVLPARFSTNEKLSDRAFQAFGYPKNINGGTTAEGIIGHRQEYGWIEIKGVNDYGYFIEPGFSGTGVYNKANDVFYGIINTSAEDTNIRLGCFVPIRKIMNVFVELESALTLVDENKDIWSKIDDDIAAAFDELDERFLETSRDYKLLRAKFDRLQGLARYSIKNELIAFLDENNAKTGVDSGPLAVDYGDLLFDLDFEHATNCFQALVQREQVLLAFVIRGKGEDHGQRWLMNKLIHNYAKNQELHDPFSLDFLETNTTVSTFIFNLCNHLGVVNQNLEEPMKNKIRLKNAIYDKLETKSQFIILMNAYQFVHSVEFEKFLQLLRYFSLEFNESDRQHKCIFIFVEEKISERYEYRDICVFADDVDNTEIIKRAKEFCFIDLGQTPQFAGKEINDWVNTNYSKNEMMKNFEKQQNDINLMTEFVGDGNPQRLIPLICSQIGLNFTENESIWMKY
jgi:hypothetical protein